MSALVLLGYATQYGSTMEELWQSPEMLQPFIQGCGPWRTYFKDHITGG